MSLPAVLLYDSGTPASSWAQDLFRSNVYIICAPPNAVFSIQEDFKTVELPATVTIYYLHSWSRISGTTLKNSYPLRKKKLIYVWKIYCLLGIMLGLQDI